MIAIILGWNPELRNTNHWNGRNYAAVVEEVAERGLHVQTWSLDRGGNIPAGAEAWLILQGAHVRGLIGHGVVVGGGNLVPDPSEAESDHPDADKTPNQVQVAFDALLPLGDQVPAEVLSNAMPDLAWESTEFAGVELGPGHEAALRTLWTDFGPGQGTDPTQPVPGTYPDGAVTRVSVNRYERDPEARRACIAHRGSSCAVCGFSFELAYGELGKDFIDVHHVVPVAQLGGSYQLDPLTDLVPLCANCHAMAHYGISLPRSEVELRRIIASAGYLRGSTVTPDELEAQQAAREILGQE